MDRKFSFGEAGHGLSNTSRARTAPGVAATTTSALLAAVAVAVVARRAEHHKRATVAIAHKILVAVFHILADGTVYEDLGASYLDALNKTRTSKHLVRRLEALGFRVAIEPTAA